MPNDMILLIDPFKNLINTYQMMLEEEGYGVETALNLEKAYSRMNEKEYVIIITEYIPPFEKTDEMIQWVKKKASSTYIIMVTNATVDEKTYEKLFTIGVDDFILKPYAPDKILVHVKKGLKQREWILHYQELKRLSLLDPVTQESEGLIFNRIFFEKCLRQELKKARRHHHPFSLLLVQFPSREEVGDRLESFYLELIKVIRRSTREEDVICKNNGEMGIILPETDVNGSQALRQRLYHLIQSHPSFRSDEVLKPYLPTLSFQSYTFPDQFEIPESLKAVINKVSQEYPIP